MFKFDPLLDFYDPTFNQATIDARARMIIEYSERILTSLQSDMVETGISPFSRFGKSFDINYHLYIDLMKLSSELYHDDFVFLDCSYTLPLDKEAFELYRFITLLDTQKIFFHLRTPITDDFLRDMYSLDYRVSETKHLNPFKVEYRFIDVYNYPKSDGATRYGSSTYHHKY